MHAVLPAHLTALPGTMLMLDSGGSVLSGGNAGLVIVEISPPLRRRTVAAGDTMHCVCTSSR